MNFRIKVVNEVVLHSIERFEYVFRVSDDFKSLPNELVTLGLTLGKTLI